MYGLPEAKPKKKKLKIESKKKHNLKENRDRVVDSVTQRDMAVSSS